MSVVETFKKNHKVVWESTGLDWHPDAFLTDKGDFYMYYEEKSPLCKKISQNMGKGPDGLTYNKRPFSFIPGVRIECDKMTFVMGDIKKVLEVKDNSFKTVLDNNDIYYITDDTGASGKTGEKYTEK